MTVLAIGGEMGFFVPSAAGIIEASAAGSYDSAFARGYTKCTDDINYAETPAWVSADDLWAHFEVDQTQAGTSNIQPMFVMLNGVTEKIRLRSAYGASTWDLEYHNGAAWVQLGSTINATSTDLQTIDIHGVVDSAAGSVDVYFSGNKRIESGVVDLSSITGITKARFPGMQGTLAEGNHNISQVIVLTGETTIGKKLMTWVIDGEGADSDWSGVYSSINELVYSDASSINSTNVGDISMYTGAPHGSIVDRHVHSFGVYARAKNDGAGQLDLAVRVDGQNYFSASKALDFGYGGIGHIWEENPDGPIDWGNTLPDEIGVRSAA